MRPICLSLYPFSSLIVMHERGLIMEIQVQPAVAVGVVSSSRFRLSISCLVFFLLPPFLSIRNSTHASIQAAAMPLHMHYM